jgi:hypothetical protein
MDLAGRSNLLSYRPTELEREPSVNTYDRVRYPRLAFAVFDLAAISVFSALFGPRPRPLGTSRILKIDSGEGVNLVNVALSPPKTEFVGDDLSEQSIVRAGAAAETCRSLVRFGRAALTVAC